MLNTVPSRDSCSPFHPSSKLLCNRAQLLSELKRSSRSFTAISGNLVGVPALVGNVLVWKPSPMATYSSWLVLQILLEAGLPRNVIQFLPCPNGQPTIDLVGKVRPLFRSVSNGDNADLPAPP